jgi:hypothetical protein
MAIIGAAGATEDTEGIMAVGHIEAAIGAGTLVVPTTTAAIAKVT